MTLIDCVDDTNMLNKIILQEIKSEDIAGTVCEHKFGKRVILHLLRPRLNKYSPPNLQAMMLSPDEMKDKVLMILDAAARYLQQIPEDKLDVVLPGRPRSYRQLAYHEFDIPKVFLDRVEHDAPYTYEALISQLPAEMATKQDLLDYGQGNRKRFNDWWERDGKTTDFKQPGKVYYGEVTLHEVLERTGWHSGQHTRQIILMLREKLGIEPDGALEDKDFEGLPMPKNVWDNERSFDEASYAGSVKVS